MAPPPVFSLYTDHKFRIWRTYGSNRCVPVREVVGGELEGVEMFKFAGLYNDIVFPDESGAGNIFEKERGK